MYNPEDERELPVAYTRFMTVSLAYPGKMHSILEIGFGGGRTAVVSASRLPNVAVTSVELDPAVLDLAQEIFRHA